MVVINKYIKKGSYNVANKCYVDLYDMDKWLKDNVSVRIKDSLRNLGDLMERVAIKTKRVSFEEVSNREVD